MKLEFYPFIFQQKVSKRSEFVQLSLILENFFFVWRLWNIVPVSQVCTHPPSTKWFTKQKVNFGLSFEKAKKSMWIFQLKYINLKEMTFLVILWKRLICHNPSFWDISCNELSDTRIRNPICLFSSFSQLKQIFFWDGFWTSYILEEPYRAKSDT